MITHGNKIKLFAGNSNPALAKAIAEKLGLNKSTVSRSLARSMERLYKSLRYSL